MQKPDFGNYTAEQLRQILSRIDRERFPDRVQEIQARLARLEAERLARTESQAPGLDPGSTAIAGFWRRSGAFLIDILVLGLVGYGLGLLLHAQFAALGAGGRAVGFVIALAYFGSMDSRLFEGRSVGKRALDIRVADARGRPLSVRKALLRSTVFCIPYFLNGIALGDGQTGLLFPVIQALAVFVLGGAICYLFLFNRRTRQSIHDLLVGALVVHGSSTALAQPAPLWRGHLAILTAWCVLAVGALAYLHSRLDAGILRPLMDVQQQVNRLPGIRTASIVEGSHFASGDKRTRFVAIQAVNGRDAVDQNTIARDIARIVLLAYPRAQKLDAISVSVMEGYDIGIASNWRIRTFSSTPDAWRKALAGQD